MIDYEAAAGTAPSQGNLPFLEANQDCKLLVTDSRNNWGAKGNRYIIKVRVLEASPTGAIPPPVPGADRCVIINLDPPKNPTQPDYGMQNLMNYACGLNGGPIQGATPQEKGAKLSRLLGVREIDQAEASRRRCAPMAFQEAFAIGMVVGDRTVGGTTNPQNGQPGHPITYHNWYSLPQTIEQILARKDALKTGKPIEWTPVK